MIKQMWSKLLIAAALVLAVAAPAAAQDGSSVSVGFVVMKWVDFESTAKGVAADFSMPISRPGMSIVADVTFAKDGDETDSAFGGGARYMFKGGGKARVFVQAVAGVIHWSISDCCSDSAFYIAPGGGVLFPIGDKLDFKGQVDFMIPAGWDDGNLVRLFLGVNFQLGKK